ncbi:MAG: hypothetical protein GF372_06150 [Candidatus Marinimicrobia bacterium]|nr:hypothetical protein [Candidatus Neomarinimicrobiota bacterium]
MSSIFKCLPAQLEAAVSTNFPLLCRRFRPAPAGLHLRLSTSGEPTFEAVILNKDRRQPVGMKDPLE